MTTTRGRIDELRAHLDATDPDWQTKLRTELDRLTPGWESFPHRGWDDQLQSWVTIVLLAQPEAVSPPAPRGLRAFLRRWFKWE